MAVANNVLTNTVPLDDENRTLWYAAAFVLNHDRVKAQLADHIRGREEQAVRLLAFICPSLGHTHEVQHPLSLAAIVALIAMTGPMFPPQDRGGSGYQRLHSRGEAATSVHSLIYRLGKDLTREAADALAQLHDGHGLEAWRSDIAYVMVDQARQLREFTFKYPSVVQVVETLNQGRPANAADLQALVNSHLYSLRAELRDGPTDGWKGMWNLDSYGKPTQPRPENNCRDHLLELLRPRLFPVGVAAEPEGHYAEDKRADIKAIIGSLNLPVEIKRHYHADLWTAPCEQLKKLYSRDPGTAGRGIYLVLWFGTEVAHVPVPPAEITAQIQTPSQLEGALLHALPHSDRESIEIVVIDCAPPPIHAGTSNGSPAGSAVRKSRRRRRS